jgi:hypothetical protein
MKFVSHCIKYLFYLYICNEILNPRRIMATEVINPVELIVNEMRRQNMKVGQLAEKIRRDPSSVHIMLKKKTISVERYIACSRALNHNFLLELGYKLPYKRPDDPKPNPLNLAINSLNAGLKQKEEKIEALQKEINDLTLQKQLMETELNTLKQVMKDIFASRQV